MIKKIGSCRNALMGFAILWIMSFHTEVRFSFHPLLAKTIGNFFTFGYGGVDIFLFLSGFGLYRSLAKSTDQLSFYARRLRRVLPSYLPILAAWLFLRLRRVHWLSWPRIILGNLTGLAFWTGSDPAFNWYMLALFSFYLAAPLIFQLIQKPFGAQGVLLATLLMDYYFHGNENLVAVIRFTIFAMGMILGHWSALGRELPRFVEPAFYLLGILSAAVLCHLNSIWDFATMWYSGAFWYPFIFIAPALTFALSRLFFWTRSHAPGIFRGFEAIGTCSLEIYLIHIVAFDYIHATSNWIWLLVCIAMILCGYLYHLIVAKAVSAFPSRTGRSGTE